MLPEGMELFNYTDRFFLAACQEGAGAVLYLSYDAEQSLHRYVLANGQAVTVARNGQTVVADYTQPGTPNEYKKTLAWYKVQRFNGRVDLEAVREAAKRYIQAVQANCKERGVKAPAMKVDLLAR